MESNLTDYIRKSKELYSITGIPNAIIYDNYHQIHLSPLPPDEGYEYYGLDIIKSIATRYQLPLYKPLIQYIHQDAMISVMRIAPDVCFVLGPAATPDINIKNYLLYMQDNYPPDLVTMHMKQIQGSPRADLNYMYNTIILAMDFLSNIQIQQSDITLTESQRENKVAELENFFTRNTITIENLTFENEIYHLIKAGNVKRLREVQARYNLSSYYYFQENDVYFLRIAFIFYASICCHYAHMGGMDASLLREDFRQYMIQIEALDSPHKFWELLPQFSMKLCQAVHEKNRAPLNSQIVQNCIDYITENLYTRITIEMLENVVHASRRTILRHFKEYLNTTPAQYIADEKLKEVAYLLENSNLSIIYIANLLGYSSQSHMCQCFLKKYRLSPNQYRASRKQQ